MRILHTADWHLGQTLHGVPRTYEHARFLAWLLDVIERESIELLVIAGDIFDAANPGPIAQEAYYRFLAGCRAHHPRLSIAVVGGNHDSPQRLDAPKDVLGAIDVFVMGGFDASRAIVPVKGARLLAVPFLKRGDLPLPPAEEEEHGEDAHLRLVEAYRALYRELTDRARLERKPNEALIATGHCYMNGGLISELSERKIQVGNQHALPVDIFPRELAYVALGHLHRAQSVEGRENVRYSGSPIPLSMSERTYAHQVLAVDVAEDRLLRVQPLFVPRAVEMLSIPDVPAPLEEVLERLRLLPEGSGLPEEARPFLEVKVLLDAAKSRLRQDIEEAIAHKDVRLVRIDARFEEKDRPSSPARPSRDLGTISPDEVFKAAYARQRSGEPSAQMLDMFHELVEEAERRKSEEGRG